ncbi:hypothetical protein ZHAS_00005898 [Anopheles sinensis]|uniref:Uncharacterized protein n=1 Tax=Anopheles sinensis TaxID=74873 RepID=A0A084VKJ8_ANOSI|nr:hypothetical protein ZHAS_00005898 [Anopheles sinensis]
MATRQSGQYLTQVDPLSSRGRKCHRVQSGRPVPDPDKNGPPELKAHRTRTGAPGKDRIF